ncbi:glutathione ABC transporter ATP-binding protein GsiA [Microvirga sp. KLBC 81]|uniref:ABC transporter ATP-binding protein n=1 Tax=Microvirga sp. KLBC 81 TaxID=1862707 RepID=UPI000D517BED|nr:ABC transporter ATP-binding protein [Microvirga sp. KLBC 81]PVE20543.1 glutathione ABC transporter ATP-binding protein GsiA [Microvirga sp. KLBC 81]
MESILDVQELTAAFRVEGAWRPVVRNLSFSIGPKETVAIVGESGSGKSVTALSIMRLLPRDTSRVTGRVLLKGRDLLGLPNAEMRRVRGDDIAMIFQEPMTSLNPVLTIGFQIAEALMLHRRLSRAEADAETVRLLEKVRIPNARARLDDYPHRFSGGMRQRVMIAMALACRPKLLIADEPTTALDVTIQAQILDLIKSLQDEEGMSVLFITHDMGVVAEIADRTVVMLDGEAVESGSTETIFARPRQGYTRALIASVPVLGSMAGRQHPMRLPVVDRATGILEPAVETPDTIVPSTRPVLEVKDLTTRFDLRSGLFGRVGGRVHAVENVSFSLARGETLALVGESGCGKSTTGRSVMRLIEPLAGSVRLDGEDLMGLSPRELQQRRRLIQMIFQDPFASLDPRMTIGTAIAEPLLINKLATRHEAREIAADLLSRVGLSPDMTRRFPHEFSGGQRQRIAIARALAVGPKVIVADEAVSALDVSVKAQVVNLMLDLQADLHLAFLFISHDMAVVERVSHRIAVMYLGEIVEIGPRSAILENPQHPYTRRLLAAVPVPDPARRGSRHRVSDGDIKSPIRSVDYLPPERLYREVSPGHVVQVWGEEWNDPMLAKDLQGTFAG